MNNKNCKSDTEHPPSHKSNSAARQFKQRANLTEQPAAFLLKSYKIGKCVSFGNEKPTSGVLKALKKKWGTPVFCQKHHFGSPKEKYYSGWCLQPDSFTSIEDAMVSALSRDEDSLLDVFELSIARTGYMESFAAAYTEQSAGGGTYE